MGNSIQELYKLKKYCKGKLGWAEMLQVPAENRVRVK